MKRYKLQNIREYTTYSSNWGHFVVRPFSDRMLWVIANYTRLTPNQLSMIGIPIGLLTAWCFFQATHAYLIAGAFLFQLAYAIDCMDGGLARLKGMESKLGFYLDGVAYPTAIFLSLLGLVYGQYRPTGNIVYFLLGFGYLFMRLHNSLGHYMMESYRLSRTNGASDRELAHDSIDRKNAFIQRVKAFIDSKHIAPGITATDTEAMVLFLFPIVNQVKLGLLIGLVGLLVVFIGQFRSVWTEHRLKISKVKED